MTHGIDCRMPFQSQPTINKEMKKTININISGVAFHIDDDAYEKLNTYLESLRTHFAHSEGKDEIISDIESRIAEVISEQMHADNKEVVGINEVDYVIGLMGNPDQFEDTEDYEDEASSYSRKRYKKLYRAVNDRILGGVCSGLSHYLRVDTIWTRLIVFISFFVTGGFTLLLYAIFWAVLPKAQTTADILQMQGERVNVTNIEKRISNQIGEVREGIESGRARSGAESFLSSFFSALGQIARGFLKICWFVLKIFLVIWLAIILISLLVTFISLIIGLFTALPVANSYFFSTTFAGIVAGISSILFIGIPIAAILIFLARKIFKTKPLKSIYGWALFGLWLLGTIGLIGTAASQVQQFRHGDEIVTSSSIDFYDSDTLILASKKFEVPADFQEAPWVEMHESRIGKKRLYVDNVSLDVTMGSGDEFVLTKRYKARGKTRKAAADRAAMITYQEELNNESLFVNRFIEIAKPNKWRAQEVELTIEVPVGKTVFLDRSLRGVMYDIQNVTNTHDSHMMDRYWTMTENGLECINCSDISNVHSSSVRHGKDFEFDNFSELDISGIFEIDIRQDDEYKVTVASEDNLFFKTQIRQEGNRLIVDTDKDGLTWRELFEEHRRPRLYITMPELEQLDIEGMTRIELHELDAESMMISLDGASQLSGSVDTENLTIEVEGASNIELEGRTHNLDLKVEGLAKIDMDELLSHIAKVEIDGGGKAYINVVDELDAKLRGISEVNYKGDPDVTEDIDGIARLSNY